MLLSAALSALVNLVIFAGLPFLAYWAYERRRRRSFDEIAQRAGLHLGDGRYFVCSLVFAVAAVAVLMAWPPPLDTLLREGSPQRSFQGLGLSATAIVMALLYGVIKTGFTEELLFRGLIAGSLSRRLSPASANLGQALVFLLPHLLLLRTMPELVRLLPVVFAGALFLGWVRIKSGSISGPWLVHASLNVGTCLSVAIRSAAASPAG
jgi:CAAX protease family protein